MLEPFDPANPSPTSGDGRRAPGAVASGPPRPVDGRADVEPASADRACHGAVLGVQGDPAGPTGWSGDWLQLSHELRTPLNVILGNIELLLDGSGGPLAAPARACIGDIQVASRQLLRQLQPLLLLIQARTSGKLETGLPVDLLGLIRQASANPAPDADPCGADACDAATARGRPSLPEGVCLMVPGDPVWLGALAAAVVDLHAAAPEVKGPLSIELEQPGYGAGGLVLRVFWTGLDPAATSPLPLTLIDAVLALHGGRIRTLGPDGLRLELPVAAVASGRGDLGTSRRGHR